MSKDLRQFRLATARKLRANATGTEQKLWQALRRLPVHGSHFRRQVALGPYVVDFACQSAKLVIEVDGSQHASDSISRKDAVRTQWLETEGYRVLRVWNSDVSQNLEGVLEAVFVALDDASASADHPTPASFARRPSPSRGG